MAKRYRRKRSYRAKRVRRSAKSIRKVVKAVLKSASQDEGVVYTAVDDAYVIPTSLGASDYFLVPTVAQGITENNRRGNALYVTSMHITGKFLTEADFGENVRIVIIRNKGPGAVNPDLLFLNQATGFAPYTMYQNDHSYQVLYDHRFRVNPNISGGIDHVPFSIHLNWHKKPKKVMYTDADTLGSLSNIISGYIGCFAVCATGQSYMAFQTQFTFRAAPASTRLY